MLNVPSVLLPCLPPPASPGGTTEWRTECTGKVVREHKVPLEPAENSTTNSWLSRGVVGWRVGLPLAASVLFLVGSWSLCQGQELIPAVGVPCVCTLSRPRMKVFLFHRASRAQVWQGATGRSVCMEGTHVRPHLHKTTEHLFLPWSLRASPFRRLGEHSWLWLSNIRHLKAVPIVAPTLTHAGVTFKELERVLGEAAALAHHGSSPETFFTTFLRNMQNGNRSSCQGISTPNR